VKPVPDYDWGTGIQELNMGMLDCPVKPDNDKIIIRN